MFLNKLTYPHIKKQKKTHQKNHKTKKKTLKRQSWVAGENLTNQSA